MQQSTFGDRLRFIRTQFDQSLDAFGKTLGYDKSYLSRLESGKNSNPSVEFIEAVCLKLGVSRRWLEKGEGKPVEDESLAEVTRQINSKNLFSEMGLAARAMILEDEICTVQVIRLLLREQTSLRDRLQRGLALLEDPSITPSAKAYWSTVFLRACFDAEKK